MSNLYTGRLRINAIQVDPSFRAYYYQDNKKLFYNDVVQVHDLRQESLVHFTIRLAYLVSTYSLRIDDPESGFAAEDLRSHLDVINEEMLRNKLSLMEQYTNKLRAFLIGKSPLTQNAGYASSTEPDDTKSAVLKQTLPSWSFEFLVSECEHSTLAYFDPKHPVPLINRAIKELYFVHAAVLMSRSVEQMLQPSVYNSFSYTHPWCLDQFAYDLDDDFILDIQGLKNYNGLIKQCCKDEHACQQYYLSMSLAYQVTRALLYSYLIDHRFDSFEKTLDLEDPDVIKYDRNLKLNEAVKTLSYSLTSDIYTSKLRSNLKFFIRDKVNLEVSGQVSIGDMKNASKCMSIDHLLQMLRASKSDLSIYKALSAQLDSLQTQLTGLAKTVEGLKANLATILHLEIQDQNQPD